VGGSIYADLGVRTVINAAGPLTRLSGGRLDPEVAQAMVEASRWHVRIKDGPPICLAQGWLDRNAVAVNPTQLTEAEVGLILDRLKAKLG